MAIANSKRGNGVPPSPQSAEAPKGGKARKFNRWATEAHRNARMPSLDIPAAKQFPKHWNALPTHHKILHALAHAAGLTVTHTEAERFPHPEKHESGWLWIGSEEAFRASALLNGGFNYGFERLARAYTGEGIDVDVVRGERGLYALHTRHSGYGVRSCARLVTMADNDASYQAARAAMLCPIEGLTVPKELYDWRGPIKLTLHPFIVSAYLSHWGRFKNVALYAIEQDGQRPVIEVTLSLAVALGHHALDQVYLYTRGNAADPERAAEWHAYAESIKLAILAWRNGRSVSEDSEDDGEEDGR